MSLLKKDYSQYSLRPIVISAKQAIENGLIKQSADKQSVVFNHSSLNEAVTIPLERVFFDTAYLSLQALNKALSSTANSPLVKGESLRSKFDKAFNQLKKAREIQSETNQLLIPYGSYIFDQRTKTLHHVAPAEWHILGLIASNGDLSKDPKGKYSWHEVRDIFDNVVIGFAGASVGGNIIEAIMKELRPKIAKVVDLDTVELGNLNRLERATIGDLSQSLGAKSDPHNIFEVYGVNKAELAAYYQHMINPYMTWYVFPEGFQTEDDFKRFILGDGKKEPKIDIFVEEMDNPLMKYMTRKICRELKIPVVMASDFGDKVQVQFQDFKNQPNLSLGYNVSDEELDKRLKTALSSGNRADFFLFVDALCGPEYADSQFGKWVKGVGEQPVSSLPQLGTTAMVAAGLTARKIAQYLLGYKIPERFIFDMASLQVEN